jgi:hypothetical protein
MCGRSKTCTAKLRLAASIIEDHGYRISSVVFRRNRRHPFYTNLVLLKQSAGRPGLWPDEQLAKRISEVCSPQSVPPIGLCRQLNVSPIPHQLDPTYRRHLMSLGPAVCANGGWYSVSQSRGKAVSAYPRVSLSVEREVLSQLM